MKNRLFAYLGIILLLVLTINFVSASDMTYKKGSNIDLKIPCVLNDAACLVTTNCNLTINYPNGSNLIKSEPTINNLEFQNYTLLGENITQLGKYQVIMFCVDGTSNGYTLDSFEVTSTGATNEFMVNVAIFIFILFAVLLLILGINKEDPIIIILSAMLFIFAGFWIFYNPMSYFPDFINSGMSWVLWGLGVYFLIATAINFAGDGW